MKKTLKLLSVFLSVVIFISVFSVANPVLATEIETITQEATEENTEETEENENDENVDSEETTAEPEIIGEDETRRDETTKHFILSNGNRKAVKYSEPIHYKENGEWVDIDNGLEYDGKTNKYKNKANDFKAYFDEDLNSDELFSLEKDGYTISWKYNAGFVRRVLVNGKVEKYEKKYEGNDKHLHKKNGKFKYSDFEADCDLEYIVTSTGVKENIILQEPTEKNEFSFDVTAAGMNLIKNDDGSISVLSKETQEEIFYIPAPFMYDSDNEYSNAVEYVVKEQNGNYIITVVADKEWLSSEERIYPVTIDPVVETRKTKKAIDSTFIASGCPNQNMDEMRDLYVGVESSEYEICQTLVSFSEPELNNGDIIVGAMLSLYLHSASFYHSNMPDKLITAHKITESWTPSTVTWNSEVGFNSVALDYNYIKQSDTGNTLYQKVFDITKAVKDWYELNDNHGILIKAAVEEGSDADVAARGIFWSDKYNNEDEAYPYISIEYRNNKGIEDYWSYSTYSIGAAGTAFVNDYTGNLVYEAPILTSNSEIMPLTLTAIFNNYCANKKYSVGKVDNSDTPEFTGNSSRATVAKGFRLNIQETVLKSGLYGLEGTALTNYPYVYTDADGTEHYIQKVIENKGKDNEKTTYKDEDGLGLTLEVGGECKYRIKDKDGNVRYFNSMGNLYKINDTNGNEIHIYFKDADTDNNLTSKSKISYITDGAGHKYTFNYYISKTTGKELEYIKSITDDAGRKVTFETDEGLLRSIEYNDGTKTSIIYEYEADGKETDEGLINYIIDNDGYGINFNYTSKATGRRVRYAAEYCATDSTLTSFKRGTTITFDRAQYNTTVIRSGGMDGYHYTDDSTKGDDDVITTLQFDNMGRTVSQQLKYGSGASIGAGSYTYTSATDSTSTAGSKNKVKASGTIGRNVVNLLDGGNAESADDWGSTTTADVEITSRNFVSTAHSYMGKKSLGINITDIGDSSASSYFYQTVRDIATENTYTLSAYVKTLTLTEVHSGNPKGAYLRIKAYNSDGDDIKTATSDTITEKTDEGINDGWRRLSVSLKLPKETSYIRVFLFLRNMKGYAYFDSIQLEKNLTANNYNMLENASFEKVSGNLPKSWSYTNITYPETGDRISTSDYKNGSKSIYVKAEADTVKQVYQKVAVKGNPNDTYIVSGWGGGRPVNSTFHYDSEDEPTALFEIGIKVHYTVTDDDGNTVTTATEYKSPAKFNTTVTGWRFATTPFVLKYTGDKNGNTYTPTHITVILRCHHQTNYVLFDHIMLTKEPAPTYKYDSKGNLISTAANAEQKVSMEYDDNNNLTSYKDTAGYKTTATYDDNHNLTLSSSPRGVQNKNIYNGDGNVTDVKIRNSTGAIAIHTSTEYYDEETAGDYAGAYIKSVSDEHGNKSTYLRNLKTGTPTRLTDANGVATSYTYYGTYEKPESVTTGSTKVKYTYDNSFGGDYGGNRISSILFSATDESPKEKYSFTYDVYGNVEQTKVGEVTLSTNTYNDRNGALKLTEYGNGDKIQYGYDKLGNVTSVIRPKATATSYAWTYDGNGTPLSHTDNVADLKYSYTYDSAGRQIQTVITDNDEDSPAYLGTFEYDYDIRNNISKISTDYGTKSSTQEYSHSSSTLSANSADYAKDNLPTRYRIDGDKYVIYDYDSLNRKSLETLSFSSDTKIYHNYIYNLSKRNTGDSTAYKTTQLATEYIDNDVYNYTYDDVGNILSVRKAKRSVANSSETSRGSYSEYRSYEYDNLYQLTRENNNTTKQTTVWFYDELGNLLKAKIYPYTTSETLGTPTKIIDYDYHTAAQSGTGWNRMLYSVDLDGDGNHTSNETITYDSIGNPLTYLGATLTWRGRALSSYSKGDTDVSYSYGADGLRTIKTVDGKKNVYIYSGGNLAYQCTYTATGAIDYEIYFFYDSYGFYKGMKYVNASGVITYLYATTNAQGDVLALYNSEGKLRATYEYDAWGNQIVKSVTQNGNTNVYTDLTDNPTANYFANLNPIRYRGYYFDSETGLYYLQSRYYNPLVGRFLNADSQISGIGGDVLGYNMFAYCCSNPVNMSDPTGHWPDWNKLVGGAGLAFGGMAAITAVAVGALACLNPVVLAGVAIAGVVSVAMGASEIEESFNGYNLVKDKVFNGNEKAYDTVRTISSTVSSTAGVVGNVTSVCFVAGTYILSQIGLIEIENIKVGDKVYSENPETGQKGLKTVVRTFENETSELVHIFVNGEEIITTPTHPFYLPQKGWTSAIELRAGDILVLQNGEYVIVERIQHEILETPITVYNFEVEDFHTYYVGNSSVLVHNECVLKKRGVKIEVRTNEHGLPHAHISGNGPNTTVGLDKLPMRNHPMLSKKQKKVVMDNWEVIEDAILSIFPER